MSAWKTLLRGYGSLDLTTNHLASVITVFVPVQKRHGATVTASLAGAVERSLPSAPFPSIAGPTSSVYFLTALLRHGKFDERHSTERA